MMTFPKEVKGLTLRKRQTNHNNSKKLYGFAHRFTAACLLLTFLCVCHQQKQTEAERMHTLYCHISQKRVSGAEVEITECVTKANSNQILKSDKSKCFTVEAEKNCLTYPEEMSTSLILKQTYFVFVVKWDQYVYVFFFLGNRMNTLLWS